MNKVLVFCSMLTGLLTALTAAGQGQEAVITVYASQVLQPVSRYLTGACLEDVNHEVYGGLYSQMVFGESFQEPAVGGATGAVSGEWDFVNTGTATGSCSVETNRPFVGAQSQRITLVSGAGELGVANQGLNRWGMAFTAGRPYEGCIVVRADAPAKVSVALENATGTRVYAEQMLSVTSHDWQHLDFTLTPSAGDRHGRLAITLRQPGSVVLGYVFLQPGAWGRFQGLPVRKDIVEGLRDQGITVLRYGGSMVNAAGYRWKKMTGPCDRRPPYAGTWYRYSSDGWGIPDFLNLCEAAGFLGVPDLNINETPQDMADFIDYVNGSTNSAWGAQRLADGHPQPYGLKYIELGNEERVDDAYFRKFKPLAEAIWARDPGIIIVVGDFSYHQIIVNPFSFGGADSGITSLAAQQSILELAKQHNRTVWFDVHVWTDAPTPDAGLAGMYSYDDALGKLADGASYKVVVFELNANSHSQKRALANALAMQSVEQDGRLPIVASANCLQPDGQNDNGWDQGLLFFNPSQVWLQPPGYVTRMISHSYEPLVVASDALSVGGCLRVSAKRSEDGRSLVLEVVNLSAEDVPASLDIQDYLPAQPVADVEELSGPWDGMNTATNPGRIQPLHKHWHPRFKNGVAEYDFLPHSFTVIKFD